MNVPMGAHLNDVQVLDTGSNEWSSPTIEGTAPTPRADTPITFFEKQKIVTTYFQTTQSVFGSVS